MRLQNLLRQGFYCDECNSFKNNYPELMKYLPNKKDGELSKLSQKEVKVKCLDCGCEKNMILGKLAIRGFSCSRCSDGISIPEKFVNNLLSDISIDFETQYSPEWSKGKKYDFYIKSLEMIIETHGAQHYISSSRGRSLYEERKNDILKKELGLENGVKKYVVIDCKKSTLEWLKKNCIKELSLYFDLSNVDWFEIWSRCQNNLIKEVCKSLNNKKEHSTTTDIANKFGLSTSTIIKYLKIGTELGWCKYNPIKEKIKQHKKSKKVCIQYTKNNKIMKRYPSIKEASKQTTVDATSISNCCRGKYKTAGGYIWKYAE